MVEQALNDWLQLSCVCVQPQALEEALWASGALAVTLSDAADNPVLEPAPGSTPLWPVVKVTALFAGDTPPQAIESALALALGPDKVPSLHYELLEDRAWQREWLRYFAPRQFGQRLWVVPGTAPPPAAPAAVCLRLDPGLAFGTGSHPTTELCLRWLDAQDLSGKQVLDYGCGSGILAIAALCLGAAQAHGTDIDPQALQASAANALRNDVHTRLQLHAVDALPVQCFDVVLANILSDPLIELAPRLAALLKPGGSMVLSGLLETQATAVKDAYRAWVDWHAPRNMDGWVCLVGTRKDANAVAPACPD